MRKPNDNYTVFEAENGVQALEMVEKENIDIIISDIMMPEMDGLELCNRLKSDPAYSHLPLVLLSAKTDTSTKIEGLNQGADVYMEKPFSIEQLKAQISSIIENRNNLRRTSSNLRCSISSRTRKTTKCRFREEAKYHHIGKHVG